MDWWLLTFFLGAIFSLFLSEVPTSFQLFLLFCLSIGFLIHKKSRLSSGLWIGALCVLIQAQLYHSQLPETYLQLMQKKQSLIIAGEVINLQSKVKTDDTIRFNFLVNNINNESLIKPIIVRLNWKKSLIEIAQGNKLSLKVKLKPAHGLSNLGSFNYLSWLKAHNIVATGYVINPHKSQLTSPNINQLVSSHVSVRQELFEQYQKVTPVHPLTPILLALAFGERSSLNPELWQVLQATGTSHLIAISGLHVGLLAGSAFFIVVFITRYLPIKNSRWQYINIRYIAITLSLTFALFYAYLAGFSLPTQRALVMLNLYWCSRLIGIHLSVKRLILLTIFILLLIDPFSLLTASFWLSFYAVIIIFATLWRCKFWLNSGNALWRFIKGLLIIQVALTLMLIPITAVFFQQISLVSLAANIIAVPWMSAVSIPTTLLSVLALPLSESLATWLMTISLTSLTWLWQYLELLSKQEFSIIYLSLSQQLIVCCAGIIILVFGYFLPFALSNGISWLNQCLFLIRASLQKVASKRGLFLLFTTTFLMITLSLNGNLFGFNQNKNAQITSTLINSTLINSIPIKTNQAQNKNSSWQTIFFDVGQGLSILIKQGEHAILYDTGAAYPSGFNMAESVILPYLQYAGIKALDKVILSHGDNDHAGGIIPLINNIEVKQVLSNDDNIIKSIRSLFTDKGLSDTETLTNRCEPGYSFSWRGLSFSILWPLSVDETGSDIDRKQKNDDSCVLLISDLRGQKLLLTGDISAKVEQQLLTLYPTLTADILQVPHHGSKTSSSTSFLQQLSPDIALVSAGYLNRWNMPVASVKQHYETLKIPLLNSAELGQIIVTFTNEDYKIQSYEKDLRPFWFSR
ncbi:DNA internalization-related competence protein ComEC/Rec2 [Colwellia sp. E2M01]|uniref:DNA internalization-related competence protein ComEC/Rec2 n=1 Tax=Colwellia sp. E2M01 TaxID=2841561 RepID=UPI001C09401E|nr:DNA internalization-related competence protein ComEC/Rec2 [Colwellia sp. E2M01]MBU2870862.1 DNA internalization-related competence protein ComEC/Rec2 [Colwellia sp. E2M01]